MIEFVVAALPLLVLVLLLLVGRYPGLESAMRLAERIASGARARIPAALNSSGPRPTAAQAATVASFSPFRSQVALLPPSAGPNALHRSKRRNACLTRD